MIKEIDHITALKAVYTGNPEGKFISRDSSLWIAIDNTGERLRKKEFKNIEDCKKFLDNK
ncbi:MAG: hypothetical protein LKE46_11520 [Clostridium sp.]|uniref:hypothetical protein n=1 Tax=Clostridium sp. TaxID=1506 RepID=UPI0025C5BEA8|nr:hypothetical protein [Clostridium sp.]MCH3964891.1 hypothetical protein [Clostridium sp.]MCI1716614.1 hypothetical protein [Clostridium sp.]MCI1800904.1 hypothetical protein [Clostridium sp.]MCI1814791.1 hypothetical protein [Clostridium sp.]MCI1871651.1 hypothetical protein [Clostridium sp.]